MIWKNSDSFLTQLFGSYINSPRKVMLGLVLPQLVLLFVCLLAWRKANFEGTIISAIKSDYLILTPALMLYSLVYIFKPINNYLSYRQKITIQDDKIIVENYFKNYFSFHKTFEFYIKDIHSIVNIVDDGVTIHLNLTNQMTIPFINSADKDLLLKNLNPSGAIKILIK